MTASYKQTLIYVAFTICSGCVTSILLLEEWLVLPCTQFTTVISLCVLLAGSADCKLFILPLISVCAIDLLRQSPDSWWHKLPVQCFGHSLVWCMHSLGAAGPDRPGDVISVQHLFHFQANCKGLLSSTAEGSGMLWHVTSLKCTLRMLGVLCAGFSFSIRLWVWYLPLRLFWYSEEVPN